MPATPLSQVAVHLRPEDNIAVAARHLQPGLEVQSNGHTLVVEKRIGMGHKMALQPIRKGEAVYKYGQIIGFASEDIAPGDLVAVDQFIDLTKHRASTFFNDGVTAHVAFADPVCPIMQAAVYEAASYVDTHPAQTLPALTQFTKVPADVLAQVGRLPVLDPQLLAELGQDPGLFERALEFREPVLDGC